MKKNTYIIVLEIAVVIKCWNKIQILWSYMYVLLKEEFWGLMILLSKYIKGALAHFFQENIVFESLKKTLICH